MVGLDLVSTGVCLIRLFDSVTFTIKMEKTQFFVSAKMRYDLKSKDLEKGDRVKVAAIDEHTVAVARPKNNNEFDKVYIKVNDNLTEAVSMSYVDIGTREWKYID